ncbi:hypothetical protein GCM10007989_29090 [Devosia pacifica]|uniref:Uncharacterized protein n=1 Tax=Devosia pacifica TaxID=1335967 RepID=A0A918VXD7_9HYPH|nr:hypothetical protein GCM10007989_29090 [Devosia pacifica]
MADTPDQQAEQSLMPMQIAHHALLTPREKLDLLHALKGQSQGVLEDGAELGFSIDEIDAAMAEVQNEMAQGAGSFENLEGKQNG